MQGAKKGALLAALLVLVLGLCGCSLETSAENLFTLPKVPVEYAGLSEKLNTYLENGYEYVAPTGGNNIQSLQMIDMDGDGVSGSRFAPRPNFVPRIQQVQVSNSEGTGNTRVARISTMGLALPGSA